MYFLNSSKSFFVSAALTLSARVQLYAYLYIKLSSPTRVRDDERKCENSDRQILSFLFNTLLCRRCSGGGKLKSRECVCIRKHHFTTSWCNIHLKLLTKCTHCVCIYIFQMKIFTQCTMMVAYLSTP